MNKPIRPILIFPAGMPRALDYLQKCLRDGVAVIGASSLNYDPAREKYPAWLHLPYVTAPEFNDVLKQAILDFNISGVYTSNIIVWDHLNQALPNLVLDVPLVNSSPIDEALIGYRTAQRHARFLLENSLPLACGLPPKPQLTELELATLYHHADLIPGMCGNEKFHALCEIFRYAVVGDVVEIGSWWGRSAFILAMLARCYGVGRLLCVDPWTNEHLVQNTEMVDSRSAQVDASEALTVFEINLSPYNCNHINYLRMASVDGATYYNNRRLISTEAFGHTEYTGQISILHIDGNHTYEDAKADVKSWEKFMVGGGWIIIDDYLWPYGDGPQRVGNEFLADNFDKIDTSFVMGGALFIQLSC